MWGKCCPSEAIKEFLTDFGGQIHKSKGLDLKAECI